MQSNTVMTNATVDFPPLLSYALANGYETAQSMTARPKYSRTGTKSPPEVVLDIDYPARVSYKEPDYNKQNEN